MDSSITLQGAHIRFLDTQLALIHVPLDLYVNFVQPILQLLLPSENRPGSACSNGSGKEWPYEHPFCNISITPIECSVACSRALAQELFIPICNSLPAECKARMSITEEDFIVMQVDGEGLDASQRVLELTSPLAMAGISIFFITTYFSDYILVPLRCRGQVIAALEQRGFAFEQQTSSYVNPLPTKLSHNRNRSSVSTGDEPVSPSTPPPTTISELQTRTFSLLRRHSIVPTVDSSLRLVHCAGTKDASVRSNGSSRSSEKLNANDALHLGLVKCFITKPHPPFLALTLTDTEPASLLLAHTLLTHFSTHNSVLLGSRDDFLIPITLDLRQLPLESTGIVCGVAGRLVGGTGGAGFDDTAPIEMSYLSTARAGTVMVGEDELTRALDALRGADSDAAVLPK